MPILVQTPDRHSTLQPRTPGLKLSSCLSSPVLGRQMCATSFVSFSILLGPTFSSLGFWQALYLLRLLSLHDQISLKPSDSQAFTNQAEVCPQHPLFSQAFPHSSAWELLWPSGYHQSRCHVCRIWSPVSHLYLIRYSWSFPLGANNIQIRPERQIVQAEKILRFSNPPKDNYYITLIPQAKWGIQLPFPDLGDLRQQALSLKGCKCLRRDVCKR